jgi:hypothetical protein
MASRAPDVAQHAAQICVAALSFGSGAASALAAIPVSLAALLAIGASRRMEVQRTSCQAAAKASLRALRDCPDFSDADLIRAAQLLPSQTRKVMLDAGALRAGIQGGADDFDRGLAYRLMEGLQFEPGDAGASRAIEIALTTGVASCRRHPDFDREMQQALLIESARAHGIEISILERIDTRMDDVIRILESSFLPGKAAQVSGRPVFNNVLDFFVADDSGIDLQIEISVMKDGKLCLFHNKLWNTELDHAKYFYDENRFVFVAPTGALRDMGFPLKSTISSHLLNVQQVLVILLDKRGRGVEGYYLPLKVYR